jgi:hypothetical protein
MIATQMRLPPTTNKVVPRNKTCGNVRLNIPAINMDAVSAVSSATVTGLLYP